MSNKRTQCTLLFSHKQTNRSEVLQCFFKTFSNSFNLRENEQIQFDLNQNNFITANKPLVLDAVNRKVASKRKADLNYAFYHIKGN